MIVVHVFGSQSAFMRFAGHGDRSVVPHPAILRPPLNAQSLADRVQALAQGQSGIIESIHFVEVDMSRILPPADRRVDDYAIQSDAYAPGLSQAQFILLGQLIPRIDRRALVHFLRCQFSGDDTDSWDHRLRLQAWLMNVLFRGHQVIVD